MATFRRSPNAKSPEMNHTVHHKMHTRSDGRKLFQSKSVDLASGQVQREVVDEDFVMHFSAVKIWRWSVSVSSAWLVDRKERVLKRVAL